MLNLMIEKKDHIINKMPLLSAEEKASLINYFTLHPEEESNPSIDWNKWKTLTYSNFNNILKKQSKSTKKKIVKNSGIQGLKEEEDYLLVYEEPNKEHTGTIKGFTPLNWEASKIIASKYIGTTEDTGEWCVAYQKDAQYWNQYCGDEHSIFVYFVYYGTEGNENVSWGKVAVRVYSSTHYEVWSKDDKRLFDSSKSFNVSVSSSYPEFLFTPAEMKPILKNALSMVEDIGGVQAESTKSYSVNMDCYGEVEDDGILHGSISFVEQEWGDDGDDVNYNDDEEAYSYFTITYIKKGAILGHNVDFIYDFNIFNVFEGTGVAIQYAGDYTPNQAYTYARNTYRGDINDNPDTWDLDHSVKELLHKGNIDYVIMVNNCSLDDTIRYSLINSGFCNFLKYGSDGSHKSLIDKDNAGNEYFIFYEKDYKYWEKGNGNDWTSSPEQEIYDRQQSLPFGL